MIHLYIEGVVIEVSAKRATDKIAAGEWVKCEADHRLPAKYEGQQVCIYHRK